MSFGFATLFDLGTTNKKYVAPAELYLGVFRKCMSENDPMYYNKYLFFTGSVEELRSVVRQPSRLVAIRRVPEVWVDDLRRNKGGLSTEPQMNGRFVGQITYEENAPYAPYLRGARDVCANATDYFPKQGLAKKVASKFPYFLEAVAVKDLQRVGFTHMIESDDTISTERVQQMAAVGLEVEKTYEIGVWLKAMALGIRMHLQKQAIVLA